MEKHVMAVLANQTVTGLIQMIDNCENVQIQDMTISACRTTRKDKSAIIPGVDRKILDVQQACGESYYISPKKVLFSTVAEWLEEKYRWEDFRNALDSAEKHIIEHDDQPISQRLFLQRLKLLEVDKSDPNYSPFKKNPPHPKRFQDTHLGDPFYNGTRCVYAEFTGSQQYMGEGVEAERNGRFPGNTRKMARLSELTEIKLSQRNAIKNPQHLFSTAKKDITTLDEERIDRNPRIVKGWLPTCCEEKIVMLVEAEGSRNDLRRFNCSALTFRPLEEED